MFLTVEDLAERWHSTPKGIAQMRHRGVLPPGYRIGRRILWKPEDIEAWETSRLRD
jgi:predicted DNA-binding transcriptional regulator AlpA